MEPLTGWLANLRGLRRSVEKPDSSNAQLFTVLRFLPEGMLETPSSFSQGPSENSPFLAAV